MTTETKQDMSASVRRMIAAVPTNNARNEASWVVCLGSKGGRKLYVLRPDHNTVTFDLDKAHGWHYKKDAEAERALLVPHVVRAHSVDKNSEPSVARRSTFR